MMIKFYKKLVLTLHLTWLVVSFGTAQNFVGKIFIGINGAQIDGDGLAGYNMPGLLVGAAAEFPLMAHLTIQPEVHFSQKGARTSQRQMDEMMPFLRFRLNYIDIPISLNYYVKDNFLVMGGPSVNYLFSANFEDDGGVVTTNKADIFKDIELSLFLGIEYRLLDNLAVFGRWNYTMPMFPINKIAFNTIQGNPLTGFGYNAYNHWLGFGVFYSFKPNFKLENLKKQK